MNIFKLIAQKLHVHRFEKPIASQYWTFNTRRIVYECKCGKRELRKEYYQFGESFPIPTTDFITNEEIEKLLNKIAP